MLGKVQVEGLRGKMGECQPPLAWQETRFSVPRGRLPFRRNPSLPYPGFPADLGRVQASVSI